MNVEQLESWCDHVTSWKNQPFKNWKKNKKGWWRKITTNVVEVNE